MAARIGPPSPVLESSTTVLSQKRYKFATGRVKSLAQVRFIVGKKVSIATHSASPRTRGPIVSVSRYDEGALDSELEAQESGVEKDGIPEVDRADWDVHLGRRMLLGSAFTAVALSKLGASGWARAEGNDTEDEKAKAIAAGDVAEEGEETRVYDASVLGDPAVVSGDRNRVWVKLLQARVVYLGESERVPDPGDRVSRIRAHLLWCLAITSFFVIRVRFDLRVSQFMVSATQPFCSCVILTSVILSKVLGAV